VNSTKSTNLFTSNGFYGSDSDGTSIGSSEVFFGAGYPIGLNLYNPEGATVALEYREVQERRFAPAAWQLAGKMTTCSEHITQRLVSGFEYRFRIALPAGTVQAFAEPLVEGHSASSDAAYENNGWSEYHQHIKFGFNCGGADASGLI